jgi:uncharacterized protein (TIGR02246 family)
MNIKSRLKNVETKTIEAYLQSFTDAWNSKNLETFGDFFSKNSEFTDVIGQVAIGKEAIIKQHIFPFENVMKFAKFEMDDVYIRQISDSIIVISATWTVKGSVTPDMKPLPDRNGIIQFILERDDSQFVILLVHNSDQSLPYERQENFIES